MKTVVIIQARLFSSRLPLKPLLPLPSGRTVLEEVVVRCRQARLVHQVCVAIPDDAACDILTNFRSGATVVRGPELDVLERYRRAAEVTGADVIVRVTSDCPMIDPAVIDKVIARRAAHSLPYASNCTPMSYPLGYSCEAFTRGALIAEAERNHTSAAREHVTDGLRRRAVGVPDANELCKHGDFSHIRWTLDTGEDYVEIWNAMKDNPHEISYLEAMIGR